MGYCMVMTSADFKICNKNKNIALELLKKYVTKQTALAFINAEAVLKAETLSEALDECRYNTKEDKDGNIVDIAFSGEKLGNDVEIFSAIASMVEEGSYIEMSGEDRCLWRWVFKNGKCVEAVAHITWI